MKDDDLLKLTEINEADRLRNSENLFHVLFERGDFSLELFAPRGSDTQSPHAQDEVYIISSGHSKFVRAGKIVSVRIGDVLFVPAGVDHRFVDFSHDFRTWVIFFGPKCSSPAE
ncbi:cupin domain-containing protein [Pseudomonas tremae]|uniref:cupin domain-containing protein n=1 Tax=Pseudomonas tremae TaxID=200454 RepID=UPI001F2BD6BF|nr:cupin domain-containing protein [Pseudomonas tremae]MCF5714924.1 cupin domain-containing protein [Pseudomonas tremae]UQB31813.1 cupin domain-containing protein [Pseudomonas tremae]